MDKCYGIIYKATNRINGKSYIGQTVKSLDRRMAQHISDALLERYNAYFHKAIRKYGKENFKWEIIAKCNSIGRLNEVEKLFIGKYNAFKNGYNLTKGGEGLLGRYGEASPMYGKKHSEETKKKMSESQTGEKNHNYGKHQTEEAKRKISKKLQNREFSEEHKRKIGSANKNRIYPKGEESSFYGKHHTEETKKKQSESKNGEKHYLYGKHHVEETKRKISEAQIGSKSFKAKKYIVITPEGAKIFVHGLRDFCRNYTKEKLSHGNLIRVANGKQKYHKRYRCRYWEEKYEI